MVVDSSGSSCQCQPGYVQADPGQPCTQCATGTAPNIEASQCLPVDSSVNLVNGLYQCNVGSVLSETIVSSKVTITCQACPSGQYPGPGWQCQQCSSYKQTYQLTSSGAYTCQCTAPLYVNAGNSPFCVNNIDYTNFLSKISQSSFNQYNPINQQSTQASVQSSSNVFDYYSSKAAIGCWLYGQNQDCQTLANLCILNLYDELNPICVFIQTQISIPKIQDKFQAGIPWIQYSTPATVLLQKSVSDAGFSNLLQNDPTKAWKNTINFQLAQYNINGTFLGYISLGSQLSICQTQFLDIMNIRSFGTQINFKCSISVQQLNVGYQNSSLPFNANLFYELYMQDYLTGQLLNIPVLIRNYRTSAGNYPNTGNTINDQWKLVKRFFIFDTIGSITGYSSGTGTPLFIRYASSIQLKVQLSQQINSQFYIPYLIIQYQDKILSGPSDASEIPASFVIDYFQDFSSTLQQCLIAFIVLSIISIVVASIRFYFYTVRNPRKHIQEQALQVYLIRFLFYFFDVFGDLIFWLIFGACAVIFLLYKTVKNAFLLMPETGQNGQIVYQVFYSLLAITLAFKFIALVIRLLDQTKIDVLFVDHEKPNIESKQVNTWRKIFVANQWLELQGAYRIVSPETTFIWFLFFWVGLGFQYLQQTSPQISLNQNSIQFQNTLLKFAIVGFLFIAIAATQFILDRIKHCLSGSGTLMNQMVDLCTLANISILLIEEHSFGYYIHGQAPWGSSDIPLENLQDEIQNEATKNNNTASRGLKENKFSTQDRRIQVFQIYCPNETVQKCRLLQQQPIPVQELADEQVVKADKENKKQKQVEDEYILINETDSLNGSLENKTKAMTKEEIKIREEEYRFNQTNKYLKSILGDNIKSDQIHQHSFKTSLFKCPPDGVIVENIEKLHVIEDYWEMFPSFFNILYGSLDYSLVLIYIMLFMFFDAIPGTNSLVSVFCIYIIQNVLQYIRLDLSSQNISKKTYIDDCFLH